ncbi:MAG: DUF4124 domain-containing protein [Halioglobus sp.]|nr:DUF4124 domain-containing protein [Halioglobus sp.]
MLRIAVSILALLALPALAQTSIYRTVDEDGNVVFTDAPPADNKRSIERIENPHINSMPPPEQVETPDAPASRPDEDAAGFTVEITTPSNETTIPNGPGNFSVSARVSPALFGDHSLQLFMDGAPWGDPQRGAVWNLTNVFRGQHDLTVGVLDASGETVSMSDPVRVYVFRPIAR